VIPEVFSGRGVPATDTGRVALHIYAFCDLDVCMRTTVDIPDSLMKRVKKSIQGKNLTFRSVVISALEKSLAEECRPFQLRDASVGEAGRNAVSSEEINRAIEELSEPEFSL
jgi:hypothetical protein